MEAAVSSTDFLVTSITGHLYFLNVFLASSISYLIFSISTYFVFSISFKEVNLFFRISTNLSGSAVNPIMQFMLGDFFNFSGIDFSFTNGMFEVSKPLLAK